MDIMEFCQKVKKSLAEDMEAGTALSVKKITKNNGVVLHGITVSRDGRNVSPHIYMDGLYKAYENGETFRSVMDEVRKLYRESKVETSVDMSFFLDYEKMKDKVVYKAVGYERNKELLRQVPHVLFLDMALVFYCHVPQKELGSATILVYNSHLKMWGITKEHLYWDAQKNTPRILPAKILSMEDMMKEICSMDITGRPEAGNPAENPWEDMEKEEEESVLDSGFRKGGRMFVLGNEKKLFGAAAMFYRGVVEEFSDEIGKSLFILPSSLHEVILVPDDGFQEAEELWKMVCEINETQVEPEDVLTDSIYYFSRKCKKIKKLF